MSPLVKEILAMAIQKAKDAEVLRVLDSETDWAEE